MDCLIANSERLLVTTVMFAAAVGGLNFNSAQAQTLSDPNLDVQTVVSSGLGLNQPTGMRFLGNNPNDFFVIERTTGRVKRVQNGTTRTVLDLPVSSQSERGLLGIELHPNFGLAGRVNNDKAFFYYSRSRTSGDSSSGNWLENRLSRFSWNGTSFIGESVLATFGKFNDGRPDGPNHNGGPMKFGPDGFLYGVTGDLNRNESEQNLIAANGRSSRAGVIYRLAASGRVPADNPYVNHANSSFRRVYAHGVRNSFGLDFDPATGRLWDTENGPQTYDEINLVARGFNSGWRDIMGPDSRSPGGVGGLAKLGPNSVYSDPEFSFKDPIGITSINFLHGSSLGGAYDNKVLVGDNNNGQLYMLTLDAQRTAFNLTGGLADRVADTTLQQNSLRVGQGFGVVTDLVRGPDGKTYVVNLAGGEIYRIDLAAGARALAQVVPEPSSLVLALVGCCAALLWRRRLHSTTL